jgi:hypothetical protein
MGPNLLDSINRVAPNIQILDQIRVQLIHSREARPIIPKELYEPQLRKHTHHARVILLCDDYPMDSTPKDLHSLGQVGCVGDCDQRLLLAQLFYIFEWDRFPLSTLLGELVKGRDFALVRVGEADYEEEIGV